jgi:pimeloyl-ACP methyl ester carboxylesterase
MKTFSKNGFGTKFIAASTFIFSMSAQVGASELIPAYGLAHDEYAYTDQAGPYGVDASAVVADCRGLVGTLAKLVLTDPDVQCNESFPYGFKSPVSTNVYYPENIKELDKLPVVNFVGGILSNEGQYTNLVRQWASYGFIVVVSSDFINSWPAMHILGALEVSKLNKDPASPLYGKADLTRTVVAGHSAGGGASILASSLPDAALRLIDPDLKLVGSLPVEPGPLGVGALVRVPTLILTGAADVVVPAFTWPLLWQNGTIKDTPAWFATARNATHFSPVRGNAKNEFAGITTAWLLYAAKSDSNAAGYFVGPDYKLSKDSQFIQSRLNPLRVQRNSVAAALK